MFRPIGDVIKKRIKELKIDAGLDEQVILGMVEDFLKQNEFFLCIPRSFKNKELLIVCSKAVVADELNNKKQLTCYLTFVNCFLLILVYLFNASCHSGNKLKLLSIILFLLNFEFNGLFAFVLY